MLLLIVAMLASSRLANSELALERMEGAWITRGFYDIMIRLDINEILESNVILQETINRFDGTCSMLARQVKMQACENLSGRLNYTAFILKQDAEFIKTFFASKKKRGFWSALGLMDSSDRGRIDEDMDRLRGNEENLKLNADRHVTLVASLYSFVNKSMLDINEKGLQINNNFETLKNEIRKGLNFTNQVKRILELESDLLETGIWIQDMATRIERKQEVLIKVLLDEVKIGDFVTQILNPGELLNKLGEVASTLQQGLKFPTDGDGITPEIFKGVSISHQMEGNMRLLIRIKVR